MTMPDDDRGTLVVDGDAEGSHTMMTQPSYAGGAASREQLKSGVSSPMWFRGPLIIGCAGMEASTYGLEPVRHSEPLHSECLHHTAGNWASLLTINAPPFACW